MSRCSAGASRAEALCDTVFPFPAPGIGSSAVACPACLMRRTRSARLHGEAQNLALLPAATSSLPDATELMPSGHGFQTVPIDPELTPRPVAKLLNVFRPYLVKPLEEGGIPHAKPGGGASAPTIFLLARRSAMKPGRRRRANQLGWIARRILFEHWPRPLGRGEPRVRFMFLVRPPQRDKPSIR